MPVVKSYTPSQVTDAEGSIIAVAQQIVREGRAARIEGALEAEMTFYRDLPKSCSKKKRELMLAGVERPATKPDWDNLGKLVTDALEGVLYAHDAALTDVLVRKRYSEQPRTEIVLREVRAEAVGAGQDRAVLVTMAGSGELFEARALTCCGRTTR
jgi:Holliday junction resolvase RusA-like endonuclease